MAGRPAITLETEALCSRLQALAKGVSPSDIGALRGALEACSAGIEPLEYVPPALLAPARPETAWVVHGRDPDDPRRVKLIAIVFSESEARAAVARVRAHEAANKNFPFLIGLYEARVGVNYLYGLDGVQELPLV